MRKLIAVGVLVGGLLAGAGSAMAQAPPQLGIGDPLTLAASGVLIPYFAVGSAVSLLEVASPVSNNPNLHLLFFSANCARVQPSVGLPLTTNDILFQQIAPNATVPQPFPGVPTSGLVVIAATGPDGFTSSPLPPDAPIHSRMYVFDGADGTSRVMEPIILDTAEFPGAVNTWSPMRTAATFFSPLLTTTLHTHLLLICPRTTIQGLAAAPFNPVNGFPQILPPFPPGTHLLRARVYEATTEVFKRNVEGITCDCFTQKNLEDPAAVDAIYTNADPIFGAPRGTYTELEEDPTGPFPSTFTGYKSTFSVGSPLNNFFGRLSNGSRPSIQGTLTPAR